MFGLTGRDRRERTGFALYGAAVAAARAPLFYARLGVPDTLDGRFDLVCLHAALLVRRLRHEPPPGPGLAQAVFDAMFADMDISLRELGVGDMGIPRRVRAMWEAFHGRARAYESALDQGDRAALATALARNVWRGAAPEGAGERLAAIALAADATLARTGFGELAAGEFVFPAPATAPGPAPGAGR